MKYNYTIYTPGGAINVEAEGHNFDQLHKLTLLGANYHTVSEFQVWHGYTRELKDPPVLTCSKPQAPVEPGLPPAPTPSGDFTAGPIVFPELPADDDFPF